MRKWILLSVVALVLGLIFIPLLFDASGVLRNIFGKEPAPVGLSHNQVQAIADSVRQELALSLELSQQADLQATEGERLAQAGRGAAQASTSILHQANKPHALPYRTIPARAGHTAHDDSVQYYQQLFADE
jgi:hypothetical protein